MLQTEREKATSLATLRLPAIHKTTLFWNNRITVSTKTNSCFSFQFFSDEKINIWLYFVKIDDAQTIDWFDYLHMKKIISLPDGGRKPGRWQKTFIRKNFQACWSSINLFETFNICLCGAAYLSNSSRQAIKAKGHCTACRSKCCKLLFLWSFSLVFFYMLQDILYWIYKIYWVNLL